MWRALLDIPYGQTRTYGALAAELRRRGTAAAPRAVGADIARAVGSPRSIRAVGLASGRGPIPILVPCHRMAESGNAPVRYAGGPELRAALLELERPTG